MKRERNPGNARSPNGSSSTAVPDFAALLPGYSRQPHRAACPVADRFSRAGCEQGGIIQKVDINPMHST